MNTVWIGIILIIVGIISTIAGIAGGIIKMFKELSGKGPIAPPTDFIKALTDLLKALIKAPTWLALVIIGFALIGLGGSFL